MTTTSPSTGDRPGFEPRHPNAVPARCDGCPAPARWTRGGSRYCDEHAVLTTPMFRTSPASMGGPLSEAERLAEIRARLDAATPGPWHRKGKAVLGPREERDLGTGPAALLHTGMPYDGPDGRCGANAELAANAPADLAFLLNLVKVLGGQLATARELHKPLPVRPNSGPGRSCGECLGNGYSAWPCATAKALGLDGGGSDA